MALPRKYIILLIVTLGLLYMLPLQYFLSSPSLGSFYSMITAERGVTVERSVSYGSHTRHKLDIYRPVKNTKTGPIVMFIYGGSWRQGDRATYGFIGASLANRGITTIIPDYRLHPEVMFPSFVEDAAMAYGWVHHNLATATLSEPGKTRPIILMGHSAGAHIAALLTVDPHYLAATGAKNAHPAGLIGLAGPLAFDPTTDPTTKDVFASVRNADKARPIHFAGPGMPPTLLIHGLEDKTVGPWNSRDFSKVLSKADVKVCKLEVSGVGHVGLILAVSKPLRWRAPVLDASVRFITDVGNGEIHRSEFAC